MQPRQGHPGYTGDVRETDRPARLRMHLAYETHSRGKGQGRQPEDRCDIHGTVSLFTINLFLYFIHRRQGFWADL